MMTLSCGSEVRRARESPSCICGVWGATSTTYSTSGCPLLYEYCSRRLEDTVYLASQAAALLERLIAQPKKEINPSLVYPDQF